MVQIKQLGARRIAEYFIWKSESEKRPITNKKLQKLLYYAQAWSLVMRNKKIFQDKIEAWVHGPAIRAVYAQYKKFGFNPITISISKESIDKIPTDIKKFLNQVWAAYGKFDAAYLERLTHSETPWQKARDGLEAYIGSENEISLLVMEEFYGEQLKAARAAS